MAEVDDLIVKIGADVSELTRSMKKVEDQADKAAKNINDEFSKTKKGFGVAASGVKVFGAALVVATASLAALDKLVQSFAGARTLGKLAKGLEVSATEFSKLDNLVTSLGGETEDLADTIKDLNERIADAADNGGEYDEVLKSIGLSSEELARKTPTEQLDEFFTALNNVNDAGRENFVVNTLAGDAGFRLAGAFKDVKGSVSGAAEELAKIIDPLSELEARSVEQTAQGFALLGSQVERISQKIAIGLGAAALSALDDVSFLLAEINKLVPSLETFMKVGSSAFVALNTLGNALKGTFLLIRSSLLSTIASAASFGATIAEVFGVANGVTRAFADSLTADADKALKDSQNAFKKSVTNVIDFADISKEKYTELMGALVQAEKEKNETIQEENAWHEALLTQQQRQEIAKRSKIDKANFARRVNDAGNFFNSISVLMNTNSRKQFEIGKAAAIGGAIVDTYKAATGAYAALAGIPIVGPALGAAAAAAATLAGIANVNAIRSQSFGGGGSPSAAGGAGAVSAEAEAPAAEPAPIQNITQANISLVGDSFGQEQVRGLIGALNEATDDNNTLQVTGN